MSGAGGAMSKAAKKNAKRHAKKQAAAGQPVKPKGAPKSTAPANLLPVLKAQLEEAKAANDIPLAGSIREQIWVLGDLIKGVKTDMPDAELAPIIAKLEAMMDVKKDEQPKGKDAASVDPEKRIKNLRKKLEQIEKLKERQAKGEKLEAGQLEKIKTEQKTLEEIEEIEKTIEH